VGLRADAEQDLAFILEDEDCGGVPVILINQDEEAAAFIGQSGDISQVIDPDTGQAVSGRLAHVSLRISSILAEGFTLPRGISRSTEKPWLAIFTDFQGAAYRFKIQSSQPDRTLGIVTCLLELYDVGVISGGTFTFENGDIYNFENGDVFDFN
jgi:hypothetical protein